MIIVEISGGLGNQMFQYALFLKLREIGRDTYIDTSYYSNNSFRKLELLHFKGLSDERLRQVCDYEETVNISKRASFKVKRRILKAIGKYYKDKIAIFQPEVLGLRWAYLSGYWQNEKYFIDIRDKILETFMFCPEDINDNNMMLSSKMNSTHSVSLHIRRSDYLDAANQAVYGGICTFDYYRKAVEYICGIVEDAVFYIFSDDMNWVRENITELVGKVYNTNTIYYVDCNTGDQSYLDIYLMSQCKYHIIANSSFSWWGAWLGTNSDKIVVSPNRWFANDETTDMICESWIRISA